MKCFDCRYKRPGKLRKLPNRLVYRCMKCGQHYGLLRAHLEGRAGEKQGGKG